MLFNEDSQSRSVFHSWISLCKQYFPSLSDSSHLRPLSGIFLEGMAWMQRKGDCLDSVTKSSFVCSFVIDRLFSDSPGWSARTNIPWNDLQPNLLRIGTSPRMYFQFYVVSVDDIPPFSDNGGWTAHLSELQQKAPSSIGDRSARGKFPQTTAHGWEHRM
jgi:hypothetical protein